LEKRKTVGIRVPDHAVCQALLTEFGKPIISTSARLPNQEFMSDPDSIADIFERLVDLFLDAGPGGLEPSTIVDFSEDAPVVVRQGKGKL
jgi:tRNA threonylcarbamoyl adenosine modification protein (Sua5/YciO/YrdC/YwlC family)